MPDSTALVADIRPTSVRLPINRLFLTVARRMAIGGIDDALCVNLLMGQFGQSYRRPLVLMRALMLEIARSSARTIRVAQPCCLRITSDEARMLDALRLAGDGSATARTHATTAQLMGRDEALAALTCFQAVAACFADLGMPVEG